MDRLMVEELSGPNADRLPRVAQEVGRQELRFIELYGGVFGLLVGLVQAAVYGRFSQWWTMPIVGVLVGLGTNWLAIQMIFRPLEPHRYLGLVTYQGIFPKRQGEKVTFVLTQRLGDLLGEARPLVEERLYHTLRLDQLIEERLAVLDKHQFERMLRGIFQEDEVILVVIGGVLGGAVGVLQAGIVLAGVGG
jgi:uncharacterized membrane protein YheB (UPF0754 family)